MSESSRQELERRLRRPLDYTMAGGAVTLSTTNPEAKLLRLNSDEPRQVNCLIGAEQVVVSGSGRSAFMAVAELTWGVGRGGGSLVCDLPCLVTIPAAQVFEAKVSFRSKVDDALITSAATDNSWRIEGSCSFTEAPTQRSARRTHQITTLTAGAASTVRDIPPYARRVRLVAGDPDDLPNVEMRFSTVSGTMPASPRLVIQPLSTWCDIPGGMVSYNVVTPAATPNIEPLNIIWELIL